MQKIVIASDVHGSSFWCEKLLAAFEKEQAEKLVLLGDILYHGPRNELPEGYAPKKVFAALNQVKDRILAVRGNCDSEVDQMVLEFPMLADYALLSLDGHTFFLTHGHLFNAENPPLLQAGDVLCNGHFHTPAHQALQGGAQYVNCGSVSLPLNATPHAYVVYENGRILYKDLATGETFDSVKLF